MIDRKKFFAEVRRSNVAGRPLNQASVVSLEAILDAFDAEIPGGADLRWIAYTMATARHEAWSPRQQAIRHDIEEIGGANRPYGRSGFFGRGLSQLTHRENYARAGAHFGVDLLHAPDLALRKDISAGCLIVGSLEGWFRADGAGRHKLARYFNLRSDDPIKARNIINGDVAKNGRVVARYYFLFLAALRAASTQTGELSVPASTPMALPEPTPPAQTKRIQGLGLVVLGLFWSMVARKWFPAFESQGLNVIADNGGEIVAAFGAFWSWIGQRNASTPIAGTPLANAINVARNSAVQAAADTQTQSDRADDAEALPAPPQSLFDLPTSIIRDELPALLAAIRQVEPEARKLLEHKPEPEVPS